MPTNLKIIAARQILQHYNYICTAAYLLQFDFILGLNFFFLCFKHINSLPYITIPETTKGNTIYAKDKIEPQQKKVTQGLQKLEYQLVPIDTYTSTT